MNSSSPRVVLVGCGAIARAHLNAIPPEHIAALCDRDLSIAGRLCAEFNLEIPVFASLSEALTATSPNIAIICTPPVTHFDLANLALENGVHVLCEKPLALSATKSQNLVAKAQARQLTLRTTAKYRFCEGVQTAKRLLDSGETGSLQNVQIAFGADFDYTRSWHSHIALSGGGVWMDNGPHALDLARYFVGELHLESLHDWHCEGDLETEGRVLLRSQADVPVELTLSWQRSFGDHFAGLQCENGTLEIGWRETTWRPHNAPVRKIAGGYDKAASFAAQWQGFLSGDPRLGPKDGAHSIALIEAIYQAARANCRRFQPVG